MTVGTIGKGLIALGVICLMFALAMPVSLPGSDVVNLHLISERQNMLVVGGLFFIGGIILFAVAHLKQTEAEEALERSRQAEKAEKAKRLISKLTNIPLWTVIMCLALMVTGATYMWYSSPQSAGDEVKITPTAAKTEAAQTQPAGEISQDAKGTQPVDLSTQAPEIQPPTAPIRGKVHGTNRIQLDFDQLAWVEIKEANGRILLSQLNSAGTKQLIEGLPPFDLVIGNAANVRLKYNDNPVDLRPYWKVDVARVTLD